MRDGFVQTSLGVSLILMTLLSGCSIPASTTKQADDPERERAERESALLAKIRCADEGRKAVGQSNPGRRTITKFAYNQKMNTCLCEQTFIAGQDQNALITDVLTNEILAMYSVPADHQQRTRDDREVVATFDKLEAELFSTPKTGK